MLEVKNIKKQFENNIIFENVSFNVKRGEVISIIGKSGNGKSTLLKCLNRLETISDGEILLDDKSINNMELVKLREKIGIVFQDYNLFDHLTVMENLTIGLTKIKKIQNKEAVIMADIILNKINLEDKKNYYPDELSGGQRQRIAIARTLLMKPDIILLDEPTSALDKEMKQKIINLLNEFVKDGMSLIIVSHEEKFVKKVSDRIYELKNNKVYEIKKSDC